MKKIPLIVLLCFVLQQCTLNEKPELVKVENIKVVAADFEHITLNADAIFLNKNSLGGTLVAEDIKVCIDSAYVATVSSEEFKVPSKSEFTMPLTVDFSTEALLKKENNGLLGSLIKQVMGQKVIASFRGKLSYKVAGFSATYPIDHSEELLLK